MIQLPVTKTGNSDVFITIDGEIYNFYFVYNSRNKRIYVTISKDDEVIISGLRMIEGQYVNEIYNYLDLPEGKFLTSALADTDNFATLGNTGIDQEFSFLYLNEDEVEFRDASTTA